MTAELIRGQNHPLPGARLEIRVSAGHPVVAGAVLADQDGRSRSTAWLAHPGSPDLPGLEASRQAAADHRLAVDLDALPAEAHQVHVLLALPPGSGGPTSFGALAAPFVAVTTLDGTQVASYTVLGLNTESAVVAVELYRRNDTWKVRAVGQGYAGGLSALLLDLGIDTAEEVAAAVHQAVAGGLARSVSAPPPRRAAPVGVPADGPPPPPVPPSAPESAAQGGPVDYRHPRRQSSAPPPPPPAAPSGQPVAGDAAGWSMDERLYNQIWGMFEDYSRTVAAHRSAVDFADSRREQELDRALADPRTRSGPAADAARAAASQRHAELTERATAALDRDLDQLAAESQVVEPALPPSFARWDNPVWHAYQPPMETPMAVRLGDLSLPERPDLRIPLLTRLPLERGLWIDAGRSADPTGMTAPEELRALAGQLATALATRLLAVYPVGDFRLHVIDPAGAAAASLAPLVAAAALSSPPAQDAAGVTQVLTALTRRTDLVQMAVRNRASDALPPDLDPAEQLLVVHDFPHGFDDRAVTQLRYLADEGPAVGVHLMMVADRAEAQGYGPVLDPLWRSLLRVTPVPDHHLADPWVGHQWTYEPAMVPPGSGILPQVLDRYRNARRRYGS
ncbi:TerD family protein [Streptomyces sp. 549]|uniref:TerD family protein n=1 Tax=Streptomyces sp. 549 TaxID=3049076 RepID=UPI0024C20C95|nr:TerD family protein [Streptomyces sp. 549]MDK1474180.1 TerD family protein [Streptomyces sp. 549]